MEQTSWYHELNVGLLSSEQGWYGQQNVCEINDQYCSYAFIDEQKKLASDVQDLSTILSALSVIPSLGQLGSLYLGNIIHYLK